MKRFILIFLCVMMLVGLIGCGNSAAGNSESSSSELTPTGYTILTDAESYTVTVGQMVPIIATCDVETTLTYTSANEAIATVNKYGKVVGVKAGTTQVTISAPDGTAKTVTVVVEGPMYDNVLRVCLNVLYNDTELGCFNTEYGNYVEIYEDGTYTVVFDCTMDLSEATRNMGVCDLSNLTAIFLYDYEVRVQNQMYSSVTACEIRWDSVVINGQELTITNSDFKNAIKSTGIFDTNDPLNAWDGSSVAEVIVDTENHVLNIDMENPVTISITFTIRGLEFAE